MFSTLLNINGLNTIKILLFGKILFLFILNLSISVIYIECLVLKVILSICMYNISPLVVSTMQFFRTIVILIDFEMKQVSN